MYAHTCMYVCTHACMYEYMYVGMWVCVKYVKGRPLCHSRTHGLGLPVLLMVSEGHTQKGQNNDYQGPHGQARHYRHHLRRRC